MDEDENEDEEGEEGEEGEGGLDDETLNLMTAHDIDEKTAKKAKRLIDEGVDEQEAVEQAESM